jgi:hypothetical protein
MGENTAKALMIRRIGWAAFEIVTEQATPWGGRSALSDHWPHPPARSVAFRSMVCDSGRVAIHACRGDLLRGAEPLRQQLAAIPCAVLSCVFGSLKTGAEVPGANRRRELQRSTDQFGAKPYSRPAPSVPTQNDELAKLPTFQRDGRSVRSPSQFPRSGTELKLEGFKVHSPSNVR